MNAERERDPYLDLFDDYADAVNQACQYENHKQAGPPDRRVSHNFTSTWEAAFARFGIDADDVSLDEFNEAVNKARSEVEKARAALASSDRASALEEAARVCDMKVAALTKPKNCTTCFALGYECEECEKAGFMAVAHGMRKSEALDWLRESAAAIRALARGAGKTKETGG